MITNDLWVQDGYALAPAYVAVLKDSFAASQRHVGFRADPDAARRKINAHIAQATSDRIRDLIAPGLITPDSRVALTNALWFKARWSHTCWERATEDRPFALASGEKVSVATMRQIQHDGYAEDAAWQALTMPFATGSIDFEAVVPRDGHTLAEAERALLRRAYGQMRYERTEVELPRFRVRAAHRLKDALQALGLRCVFDARAADFSAMSGEEPLVVDDVVHQTWIQVDEEGCEAAAATATVLEAGAAAPDAEPKHFRADRPFAFGLRDRTTGLLLFVGRVDDPRRGAD